LWGYVSVPGNSDPTVLQSDMFDGEYGPWLPLGETQSSFLRSLEYWNAANGGAPATAFAETSSSTAAKLAALPVAWLAPDFRVINVQGVTIIVSHAEPWLYAFANSGPEVERVLNTLSLKWLDVEVSANAA
jgi:hypothetical protein